MLAHPYVSDIVGQAKTTIDFGTILSQKKIVLVKLSNRLSEETKRIIGTILVSELLHAIEHRPVEERDKQFCIFIDEFQNFASYQDFPVLITQAPKYGVATTLAHHERYGQLAGQFEIMGATAAIANKVLFQITARDAQELAPEFSEEPTTETRYEEGYIISREPVWDLLRWHGRFQARW
jgi:type IV secretory pathway TraG/TraD family ATPase VirD4